MRTSHHCEECSRNVSPADLVGGDSCPTCGSLVGDPPHTRIPWHFWLVVAAAGGYLGWRLIQGVGWVAGLG